MSLLLHGMDNWVRGAPAFVTTAGPSLSSASAELPSSAVAAEAVSYTNPTVRLETARELRSRIAELEDEVVRWRTRSVPIVLHTLICSCMSLSHFCRAYCVSVHVNHSCRLTLTSLLVYSALEAEAALEMSMDMDMELEVVTDADAGTALARQLFAPSPRRRSLSPLGRSLSPLGRSLSTLGRSLSTLGRSLSPLGRSPPLHYSYAGDDYEEAMRAGRPAAFQEGAQMRGRVTMRGGVPISSGTPDDYPASNSPSDASESPRYLPPSRSAPTSPRYSPRLEEGPSYTVAAQGLRPDALLLTAVPGLSRPVSYHSDVVVLDYKLVSPPERKPDSPCYQPESPAYIPVPPVHERELPRFQPDSQPNHAAPSPPPVVPSRASASPLYKLQPPRYRENFPFVSPVSPLHGRRHTRERVPSAGGEQRVGKRAREEEDNAHGAQSNSRDNAQVVRRRDHSLASIMNGDEHVKPPAAVHVGGETGGNTGAQASSSRLPVAVEGPRASSSRTGPTSSSRTGAAVPRSRPGASRTGVSAAGPGPSSHARGEAADAGPSVGPGSNGSNGPSAPKRGRFGAAVPETRRSARLRGLPVNEIHATLETNKKVWR
ncbi:hypothetical protein PLICRDRAFT_341271 [Plicaturopsis crispa FD-325 SS-3]|uniref:Uncharacterized protein n=1 Tax=Plicaturopsis crispa FD-325 SS-3 TaxID=944288 RepID=A0A0C9SY43_PLICR|nr:hypothetical protein PLICRDRAFT_341271 [Plicaturopsis crispa FD-325 SS-3]